MNKKLKLYKWGSYVISMFINILITIYFTNKCNELITISYEGYITPFACSLVLIIVEIFLFIHNLKKSNHSFPSFQYLKNEAMPSLQINNQSHTKAMQIFESFLTKNILLKYISCTLIYFCGAFTFYQLDCATFIYNSNKLFCISLVLLYILITFIMLAHEIILTKLYQKTILPFLDDESGIFVDVHFILLQYDYAFPPLPFAYKMNIATGLSRLGEYGHANIYLKLLWNEEKKLTKKKIFQIIYNYNNYIFSLRLHLDNANDYKDKVNQLFIKYPRFYKSKTTSFIPTRIKIEEAFNHQLWDDVIQYIYELDKKQMTSGIQIYYDYMLYIAYLNKNDNTNANHLYEKNKDSQHFQKLIILDKKDDYNKI